MSEIYNVARVRLLEANLNWLAIDLVVVAWTGGADFLATDVAIVDITARGAVLRVGESQPNLNSSVAPDGSAQTDQVVIPGVPVNSPVTWLTLCERQSNPDNHRLILSVDDALDMPFDSNGLDIVVQPDWLTKRGWFKP